MNSFGLLFRVSIYGESHGPGTGILIDGCPPGISLSAQDFQADLERRRSDRPGTSPRQEKDLARLKSGIFNGHTTGAPILIAFANEDVNSKDYEAIKDTPRPGHADFTAARKYNGWNGTRGGGHFSGRLSLGLVAAGVVAKKIIEPMQVDTVLLEAGGQADIEKAVAAAVEKQDSIGGMIECRVENVPVGLGEPFFDSLESLLGHIIFAIPAIKGIEFGAGFAAARMTGSQHNDPYIDSRGRTESNDAGGINGGISNGNPVIFRVAVKPTPSIALPQKTINMKTGEPVTLVIPGRHDTCIALRVPVVIENATAIVLADALLRARSFIASNE